MGQAFEKLPKEIFPEEYGGQGGKIQEIIDQWIEKVKEHKDYFADDDKYGVDESKRPREPHSEPLFGAEGSFRQLQVD